MAVLTVDEKGREQSASQSSYDAAVEISASESEVDPKQEVPEKSGNAYFVSNFPAAVVHN